MTFDIAARLGAAHSAVEHTEAYVSACRVIGYQQSDLTAHSAQIRDWFGGEEGMDLAVLAADCTKLRSTVRAAEDAQQLERQGFDQLVSAWQGESGQIAREFIGRRRHSSENLLGSLGIAADSFEVLGDKLARIVDAKVKAAITIDERSAGRRAEWLAAARSVGGSGGPDRAGAITIVETEILPYVDTDIRIDWVAAMRSATEEIRAAYGEAANRINVMAATHFEIPGRMLPAPTGGPPSSTVVSTPLPPRSPLPPPVVTPIPESAVVAGASRPAQPPPTMVPNPIVPSGIPPLGMPPSASPDFAGPDFAGRDFAGQDFGSAISGLIGQIAETTGGLSGSSVEPFEDALLESNQSTDADRDDADVEAEVEDNSAEANNDAVERDSDEPEIAEVPVAMNARPDVEVSPVQMSAAPMSTPPAVAGPQSPPDAIAPELTPCEMAVNELPEIGQ